MDLSQDLVAKFKSYLAVQKSEALLKDRPVDGWLFITTQGAMIHGKKRSESQVETVVEKRSTVSVD